MLDHVLRQLWAEMMLLGGVLWLWIGPIFSGSALDAADHLFRLCTTFIVFALACWRAWRVLTRRRSAAP
jgi:ABC-type nickel/cobalt efflux system permease component RcnA